MWNPLKALVVPAAALVAGGLRERFGHVVDHRRPTAARPLPATTAARRPPRHRPAAPPPRARRRARPLPSDVPVTGDAVEIIVNVDDPAQVGQIFPVALGQTVILRLVSDTDQEYHVHGVDLEKQVAAGVEATFEFTADTPGDLEVESHTTDAVLATIRVS